MTNKVAVAMSGGVDSSVTAALCVKEYGAENVFGLTMRLFCYGEQAAPSTGARDFQEKSCCSTDAVNDARKVCEQLGIKHYVVDMEKDFEKEVVEDFISQYQSGKTPNPCIKCNQVIKFERLLKKAEGLGATLLATGHYARIDSVEGAYRLLKGLDENKDQSYFLYNLNQEQLSKVLFPLGGLKKTETRRLAAELKLKTAEKAESQNICFVSGKLENYLADKLPREKGEIVTPEGEVVGLHQGIAFYTVGQRRGLGGGTKEPLYVIGLNPLKNQVIVGAEEGLYKTELVLKTVHWVSGNPNFPLKCTAKIRYRVEEASCIVKQEGGTFVVSFPEPQRAITPGQSIVFYDKEVVLGGGIIAE